MKALSQSIRNLLFAFFFLSGYMTFGQETYISSYFEIDSVPGSIEQTAEKVKEAIFSWGFETIGEYHPENNVDLYVIAFTNEKLKEITFNVKEGGALASVLKVGLLRKGSMTRISLLNPEYIFYAYLRDEISDYSELKKIGETIKTGLQGFGSYYEPFGGDVSIKDLKKYHFSIGMPYFDDRVELNEFTSFKEGVERIKSNLDKNIGNTYKVYEIIDEEKETAVFGVGLLDSEKGEGFFLPIIKEKNIAAMPYQIFLQGKQASMLNGRFWFALHWPKLTMRTFAKIRKTPGDVEDFMKALTE